MDRYDLDSTRTDLVVNDDIGDFKIEISDQAHIEHLLDNSKGAFKEFPLAGVGVSRFLNASGQKQLAKREIFVGLKADGYSSIKIENNTVDAKPLR